jgi:hypothetical protein
MVLAGGCCATADVQDTEQIAKNSVPTSKKPDGFLTIVLVALPLIISLASNRFAMGHRYLPLTLEATELPAEGARRTHWIAKKTAWKSARVSPNHRPYLSST